jgi:hypothetical protein
MKTRHAQVLRIFVLVTCVAWGAVAYLRFQPRARPRPPAPAPAPKASPVADESQMYEPRPVGDPPRGHPMITHVMIADLDQDGLPDIVACDAETNTVRWLRQYPRGVFTEQAIGDPIQAPVHATVCDINGDGKPDLLIASMGVVLPDNDKIGSVVILENLGGGKFRNHVIAENIARVTDVRAVDVNGDGKLDLVVGQFGYVEGYVQWMENLGDWKFRSHILLSEPGTITVPVADFNGDGRPTFAALVSQDSEAVHLFHGDGHGEFHDEVLWSSANLDWGSSGLEVGDINRDGRPDLVYANGDGFNGEVNLPAWQGLQWLENRGNGYFKYHRIGDFPGCYSPICVDLDGDGNMDIVAVSAFNEWHNPAAVSMMGWYNDGKQNFRQVALAHTPTHLLTVAAGDLAGNGTPELVTGTFYMYPPYLDMSRITVWTRRGGRR